MIKTNNEEVEKRAEESENTPKACEPLSEIVPPSRPHRRRKRRENGNPNGSMEVITTKADVHKSAPARVHTSARRNRSQSQSRHEKHKCHKHRQKVEEAELANQVTQLRTENYLLTRRLNASVSSIDSGLPTNESLPHFEIDVKRAYQHIKQENGQLLADLHACRMDYEKSQTELEKQTNENACLKDDVVMLKNLVYRLNVELEKFQDSRERRSETKRPYKLPEYYNKNFVKPIMPLLRAYTETIDEKNEVIADLQSNFDKFNLTFNDLLKENETLYKELEAKFTRGDDTVFEEVQMLRSELKMTKEEKDILESHVKLETDKIEEIKAVFQSKVSLLERERDVALDQLKEARADLYILQGKHYVVRQDLERIRSEDEMKVPLAVHSASIAECKRLLQELKNDHDLQKQELEHKLSDSHNKLLRRADELKRNEQDRLTLEQSNFDLVLECDTLRQKLAQYEKRLEDVGGGGAGDNNEEQELRTKLLESVKRNEELEGKLKKSKKRLQQSMAFAEDLVKEQESLLSQLHEKQRENAAMVTHFGSLRKKLKSVENGANAGLEEVEDTIKCLRGENYELMAEVERLNMLLREKRTDTIDTEDTSS